jgi:hypothetical protein
MIGEFERYHGAAIRELIVSSGYPLKIEACDDIGRINMYRINDSIGIHIKHSSKRLPPWQFTYLKDNLAEIRQLIECCRNVWLVHVCGQDGIMAMSYEEFCLINPQDAESTSFIRVDRDRNTMYRVNGTGGKLARAKRRGLDYVLDELRIK